MPNLESVAKKEHSEYLRHQVQYFNNKLLLFLDTILMCMTKPQSYLIITKFVSLSPKMEESFEHN